MNIQNTLDALFQNNLVLGVKSPLMLLIHKEDFEYEGVPFGRTDFYMSVDQSNEIILCVDSIVAIKGQNNADIEKAFHKFQLKKLEQINIKQVLNQELIKFIQESKFYLSDSEEAALTCILEKDALISVADFDGTCGLQMSDDHNYMHGAVMLFNSINRGLEQILKLDEDHV